MARRIWHDTDKLIEEDDAGNVTVTWTNPHATGAILAAIVGEYESTNATAEPTPWANLTDRVGPGQRVVWTDGETWRNTSGAWLPTTATPVTWPQGWSQETGLPAEVAPWVAGEAVVIGDLREFDGVAYRCIQAHTTQAGWTPPVVPALWTPQG